MREILFRGKRKENCEWIYGSLVMAGKNVMIYPDNGYNLQFVAPETVGQYTGMRDKNGVRIFEGDIVKITRDIWHGEHKKVREEQIGLVVYGAKHCQFGLNIKGYSSCLTLNRWKGDYNEVIGNMHDNPELLEGV